MLLSYRQIQTASTLSEIYQVRGAKFKLAHFLVLIDGLYQDLKLEWVQSTLNQALLPCLLDLLRFDEVKYIIT